MSRTVCIDCHRKGLMHRHRDCDDGWCDLGYDLGKADAEDAECIRRFHIRHWFKREDVYRSDKGDPYANDMREHVKHGGDQ